MFRLFAVDTYFKWGDNSINGVLSITLNTLAGLVGVVVVIGIVYGAILYTTASGNAAQAKKAIGIIRNALIALVMYGFFYAIMNFIIPQGTH